jgi:hypothetical protein
MFLIQETFKKDALARLNSSVMDAHRLADNMLEITREIGSLNLRAGKASADAISSAARKMLQAGNPGEFLAVAASAMRPDFGAVQAYAEQLGDITKRLFTVLPQPVAAQLAAPLAASLKPDADQAEAPVEAVAAAVAAEAVAVADPSPALSLADATVAQSVVLQDAGALPVTPEPASAAPAETKPTAVEESKAALEIAAAALPPAAPPTPKIAKKAAASPEVLAQSASTGKSRDAKKVQYKNSLPGKTAIHRSAPANSAKPKKPGF